jgi:transcription elongation factor Elf1
MKKRKNKKKKSHVDNQFDFGVREFTCIKCGHEFEVSWREIFELQEMTHGFVGEFLNNEYIACPKCYENANDEYCGNLAQDLDSIDNHKNSEKNISSGNLYNNCVLEIDDDSIPF